MFDSGMMVQEGHHPLCQMLNPTMIESMEDFRRDKRRQGDACNSAARDMSSAG